MGKGKEYKSTFDDVLEKISEQKQAALTPEARFDSRLKETQHEQERFSDRDQQDDKKDKQKSDTGKKTKDSSETRQDRILAKHDSGSGREDSSGSGEKREGHSGSGFQQKSASAQAYLAEMKKNQPAPAPNPEPAKILLDQMQAAKEAQAPRELPKAVLDQIVQYVRIGMNKNLEKEIQIDFHDNFFNGMKLKVTSHGKEVSIQFLAPNRGVATIFKQEREKIATVLGENGVEIRSILVTLS